MNEDDFALKFLLLSFT